MAASAKNVLEAPHAMAAAMRTGMGCVGMPAWLDAYRVSVEFPGKFATGYCAVGNVCIDHWRARHFAGGCVVLRKSVDGYHWEHPLDWCSAIQAGYNRCCAGAGVSRVGPDNFLAVHKFPRAANHRARQIANSDGAAKHSAAGNFR